MPARAGADEVVLLDGFKDAVAELTGGRGRRLVLDVVGGDVFTDSLRALGAAGPAAGRRLRRRRRASPRSRSTGCCSTTSTSAASAGAPTRWSGPATCSEQWAALAPMMAAGVIDPPIGATYDLAEDFGQALADMDDRRTLGKSVVRVR